MLNAGLEFNLKFKVETYVYMGFRQIFHDNNPLHTEIEYARKKGFKDIVMQGNILNGFVSYFIGEGLPVKDVIIHSQQISFISPVYLNDELNFTAIIDEVFESVKVVKFKFSFKNDSGKTVAKGTIQIGLT